MELLCEEGEETPTAAPASGSSEAQETSTEQKQEDAKKEDNNIPKIGAYRDKYGNSSYYSESGDTMTLVDKDGNPIENDGKTTTMKKDEFKQLGLYPDTRSNLPSDNFGGLQRLSSLAGNYQFRGANPYMNESKLDKIITKNIKKYLH